jgi:hypothetical protein
MPLDPGGTVEVGDGRTSVNLDGGSFLSEFQIPLPHPENDGGPWLRPMTDEEPQAVVPASAEGVVGFEPVGDMEPLANDPFRGRAGGCDVSLSQDGRRVAF